LQQSEVTSGQLGTNHVLLKRTNAKIGKNRGLFGENVSRSKTSHLYSVHELPKFLKSSVRRSSMNVSKALPVARQELPPTISHFKKRDQNQI
jgi:hypothetical protein